MTPDVEELELTEEQKQALAIMRAARGGDLVVISGAAGTGKTTLIKEFCKRSNALVCAPTNKALQVLRSKIGKDANLSTVHSLLYVPEVFEQVLEENPLTGEATRTKKTLLFISKLEITSACQMMVSNLRLAGCLICDEGSMLTEEMVDDLHAACQMAGIPLIIIGDSEQLPPIDDERKEKEKAEKNRDDDETPPAFTHPIALHMTTVMRQASGNPILKLASLVRSKSSEAFQMPECGFRAARIPDTTYISDKTLLAADVVLSFTNKTRMEINERVRALKGYPPVAPAIGERLIGVGMAYGPVNVRAGCVPIIAGGDYEVIGYDGAWFEIGKVVTGYRKQMQADPVDPSKTIQIVKNESRVDLRFEELGLHCAASDINDALQRMEECPEMQERIEQARISVKAEKTRIQTYVRINLQLLDRGTGEVGSAQARYSVGGGEKIRPSTLDYAQCLTVHKAQGSEWENVLVIDEMRWNFNKKHRRWFYTAITRASKTLSIAKTGSASLRPNPMREIW